nr:putative RNA-directed DNA polymerase, eukaryota, reverse transcriptase zinc-binding domain protein [Tanacetum cinerariifolium]
MEKMDELCVKQCWGNLVFNHVYSEAVGKSRGILCVWDPNSFSKNNSTVYDYFVIVRGKWNGDVIIMGDFNEVRCGCHFTWCYKSASKMSKLDRFLVSESVISSCPNISGISLDRYISDHRPILLKDNRYDYSPTPFRFFHHWRKDQTQLKKILEKMDSVIDSGKGNDVLIKSRLDTIHQIQNLDRIDALEIAQKAKIKWAIDGDENSGFYHGIINKRRSIQSIRGVMVEGMWIDEHVKVKKEFFDHFANRFCKPDKPTVSINVEFPNQIDPDQRSFSERDVSNSEIKKAVWECGMDKAPGPDGFSFSFFRHFLYLVDGKVYEAVRYFFTHFDLPKGCNSSFIALIPKISDANMVKDFRPISLIGSIYKIIAKILTNRLVGVLGDIINEVQSAFIEDNQILDGPFILNEVFAWCKRKKNVII